MTLSRAGSAAHEIQAGNGASPKVWRLQACWPRIIRAVTRKAEEDWGNQSGGDEKILRDQRPRARLAWRAAS